MLKLKSCCFLSLRKGCFLIAIYSLIYYSLMFALKTIHVLTVSIGNVPVYYLTWLNIITSSAVAVCSLILIAGIAYNYRKLFLPWMLIINIINVLDLFLIFQLFQDSSGLNPLFYVMALFDFSICLINIHSFICVLVYYCRIKNENIIELNAQNTALEQQTNTSKNLFFNLTPQTYDSNTFSYHT